MAWGFKKRIKIAPGLHVNIGKTGISARAGGRVAGVTVGKRGVHASANAPGTGLSVRKRIGGKPVADDATPRQVDPAPPPKSSGKIVFIVLGVIGTVLTLLMIIAAFAPPVAP